jgi:succinyl-diaminopimelate desuccinylase
MPTVDPMPVPVPARDRMPVLDPVALTQQLVRIDSPSGSAGQSEVFDVAARLLGDAGFELRTDSHQPPRYLLALSPVAGARLLFACHVDTVPVERPEQWRGPVTSGVIEDGRLFGRGASDMKSGLAAALVALVESGADGPGCAFLLTTDEEIGCLGAAAAAEELRSLDVRAVIVPESTENDVYLGHRGALWLRVTAHGRAAHGGTPHLGDNALLMLAGALLDISENGPWPGSPTELGATTVNVATMRAGSAINIVPETATATMDIRTTSPEEADSIRYWLAERHPGLTVETELELSPVLTDSADPWITSLPAGLAAGAAVPYFTDAAELIRVLPSVPFVIWGPGQASQAHSRDESVAVSHIEQAAELYRRTLQDWPLQAPERIH